MEEEEIKGLDKVEESVESIESIESIDDECGVLDDAKVESILEWSFGKIQSRIF